MSFIHLAPEVAIRFQIGILPSQLATFTRATCIKASKIDGINIRHFLNRYCKKHALTLCPVTDKAILNYCFVPAGFRKGDSLATVLASVEPELIQYIGKEHRAPQFLLLLQKVTAAAPNRAEQALAVMELMRMVQSEDGLGLVAEYPSFKAVVIAKCKELRLTHHAEFPEMAAECARLLWKLGEEVDLYEASAMTVAEQQSQQQNDETVLKNWQLLPAAPILVALEVGEHGQQACLLFADERTIYSTYYGKQVHLCRHFNRYMKASGATLSLPFVGMLKHYYVDTERHTSLYDFLLHWHEEAPLTFCAISAFNAANECNCCECLRRELVALRKMINAGQRNRSEE
jgi:hypothetical protein